MSIYINFNNFRTLSLPGGGWRRKWRSLAKRPIGSLFWGRARKQVADS